MKTKLRDKLRNKITGFIFGKYKLEDQINEYLINEEEYISGIEIIHYNEILYISSLLVFILSMIMSVIYTPYFLFLILFSVYLIFIGSELQLIYLTSERLLIERRTIVEKLLKTNNIQSVSVDQIAVVSFSRAPFQLTLIVLSSVAIGFTILDIWLNLISVNILLSLVIIIISAYIFWFGLRLTKRSIEVSVIGVAKPLGIGRKKGAPIWFLDDLNQIIFERVHHTFHTGSEADSQIQEFPLEYSGIVKQLIKSINRPVQKKILQLLDEENLPKKTLVSKLTKYSKVEIDEGMRQLRQKRYLFYSRSMNVWCINKEYIVEIETKTK